MSSEIEQLDRAARALFAELLESDLGGEVVYVSSVDGRLLIAVRSLEAISQCPHEFQGYPVRSMMCGTIRKPKKGVDT